MVQTWEGGPCELTRAQSYKEGAPGKVGNTQQTEERHTAQDVPREQGLCRTEQQVSFLGGREGRLEVPSPGLCSCSPNSLVVPRSRPPSISPHQTFLPLLSHVSLGFSLLPRPSTLLQVTLSFWHSAFPRTLGPPTSSPSSGLNVLLCQACDPRPH